MQGEPATFYNVHMSEMEDWGDPKYVDVWADDVVTLSLQYSTQWDSLAHVGAEFDADGDGVEEAVYYNGYRAGVDLVGPPSPTPAATVGRTARSPTTWASSTWRSTACRAGGCCVDLAHHLGHEWQGVDRATLEEIMAADGVVVEPGDMLLLHTGFATKVLEWERNPDPVQIHTMCSYLDARDAALLEWIADSQISALVADNYAVEGLRRQGPRPEPALVPPHPPPLPLQARRPAGRDVVPPRAGGVAARARPAPLPADRAAAADARRGGLAASRRSPRCDRPATGAPLSRLRRPARARART